MPLHFFDGALAAAGAVAAAGPLVIHLLNRRRFRVVQWAAMDFLREAVQRNRRILHLRDLILLALRTLCVLLFGLALGRPYFSSLSGAVSLDQPVHAVLVIDNSLSMGYEKLDGTLLDEARSQAAAFVERLPEGSRVSVLPLCGGSDEVSWDPYRTKADALAALKRIEVVDRAGSASQAADLAWQACQQAADVPAKRVAFFSDQQATNWPSGALERQFAKLPELQIVEIARQEAENAWIEDFKLQDGVADVETTAVFLATVRYEGPSQRNNVQVTLKIDGVAAASKPLDLQPGQTTEVAFTYRFDAATEPGQASFAAAEVSLPPDGLPDDDRRTLIVPVVAALPVVFVDQLGSDEDPQKNLYGETFLLRRLLAPVTTRGDFGRQLIQIRHATIDALDKQTLQDARLVVVAGVVNPEAAVTLLRDYVRQGGQLVIAAGGEFDPAAWQTAAWLDGAGILPAPLASEPVGRLPSESGETPPPFQLAFDTLLSDYFLIENEDREALADLYTTPVFFKAVAADVSERTKARLVAAEMQRLTTERKQLSAIQRQLVDLQDEAATEQSAAADLAEQQSLEQQFAELRPNWLLWNQDLPPEDDDASPAEFAKRGAPQVLGAYGNKLPFLIQRPIGRGQSLLITTGVFANSSSVASGWNNLATTDAVLLFDRLFRSLLERTLPRRNRDTVETVVVPVAAGERRDRFTLTRPDGSQEPLAVDALGAERYGVAVRNLVVRGKYVVTAYPPQGLAVKAGVVEEAKRWEVALAANGPASESELASLDEAGLQKRLGETRFRYVPAGGTVSVEGADIRGQDLWRWLLGGAFACLLAELAVLAWPMKAKEPAA